MPDNTLPPGLPHIAYVLLWYPLFTQPFIYREVEKLREIMPVQVYALYGQNLRHCSEEMKNRHADVKNYGAKSVLPVCWEITKNFCKAPKTTWRLFKRSCWRKWPNLEVLGENLWAFCTGISLARRFREDGIDMVYAPWPRGAATAAWIGATLAGIPFAVAARGDNLDPADPDLGDKLSAACFVRSNNLADKKRIEQFDQGQAANKTFMIYNNLTLPGPQTKSHRRRQMGDPLRILALGRFDVTKGFDVLIRACAILKKNNINFSLTLAGGGGKVMGLGNLEKYLLDLRRELDLEQEVLMPGLISHDDLPVILDQHDLFAAPCVIHSSGRRDGIPNTVIEAMAYGLPVVSTNVNALPEIVRNEQTGLTVPPNDPEALANAITRLALNPDEAAQYGENGARLAASLFDCSTNSRRLADIFIDTYKSLQQKENKCAA